MFGLILGLSSSSILKCITLNYYKTYLDGKNHILYDNFDKTYI